MSIAIIVSFGNCSNQQNEEVNYSYYYKEINCFNHVERCDVEIVKLINFDSLIYVRSNEEWRYDEYHGSLTRINDTIFQVNCSNIIRQVNRKPMFEKNPNLMSIKHEESLNNTKVKIIYLNGSEESIVLGNGETMIELKEDVKKYGREKLKIELDYDHPVLLEKVQLSSGRYVTTKFLREKEQIIFYVVISDSKIKSINSYETDLLDRGPRFELKKIKKDRLYNNRVIR